MADSQNGDEMDSLIELARKTTPLAMQGNNIALFGLTSTGKSTMINSLLGKKVAAIGAGETTMEIKAYPGTNFILWDTPGRNDKMTYKNKEYIAFWKGLTRRVILVKCTVKENSTTMQVMDAIGLDYDIVVNKFDNVDEAERSSFCQQIHREITTIGLKRVKNVFFLSAKYPQQFPDWLTMVDNLTNFVN
jgi:small GTP-binding protein